MGALYPTMAGQWKPWLLTVTAAAVFQPGHMISDLGRSAEDRQNGVADEFDDHTVEAFDAEAMRGFWWLENFFLGPKARLKGLQILIYIYIFYMYIYIYLYTYLFIYL